MTIDDNPFPGREHLAVCLETKNWLGLENPTIGLAMHNSR